MNVEGAIISGTGCISNPTTYHNDIRSIAMTSRIVPEPTNAEIRTEWLKHQDQIDAIDVSGNITVSSKEHAVVGVLLDRLEVSESKLEGLTAANADLVKTATDEAFEASKPRMCKSAGSERIPDYLKEGETVLECVVRNRKDAATSLKYAGKYLKRAESAEDIIERISAHITQCENVGLPAHKEIIKYIIEGGKP